MDVRKQLIDAFNFRYACKEFDSSRKISEADFNVILESARLSPSSFGFEPWKFLIVQNMALREKLLPFCWGARNQLPTASHFIILLARAGSDMSPASEYIKKTIMSDLQGDPSDVVARRLKRFENFQNVDFDIKTDRARFDWACMQTYIALANMMTSAALLQIDSCPIEGFSREEVRKILVSEKILNLEHFDIACMVAFGYRAAPPDEAKTRRKPGEVTEWVR